MALAFRITPTRALDDGRRRNGEWFEWRFETGTGHVLCRSWLAFPGEAEARADIAHVKKSMAGARYAKVVRDP